MIERAKKAFAEGRLLDEFIPVPKELSEAVANFEKNEALVEKYGYSSWYDFCVANWGTKWDVGGDDSVDHTMEDDNGTRISMSFDSAWAPPVTAMEKFIDLGFGVKLYYYEPGMAFAGIFDENGDDFYELGDMTADEVEKAIPGELDEMFCISESMAEWEAENAEEEEE
jgi:hypothetical protein